MEEICFCDNGKLTLATGMDEASFGKSRLALTLPSEHGLIVDFSADSERPDFIPFNFTGINSDKNGFVNLYSELAGKIPESEIERLTPLSSLLDETGGTAEKSALLAVKAITCALSFGQKLESVGAGGILAGKNFVVFLPKNLFENCLNSRTEKVKADLNGKFIFKGLSQENGLCFLRAVIAYKVLAGKFPFDQESEEARQKDIIDSLFLPLEYAVNGIDKNLASAINFSLSPKVDYSSTTQANFPVKILQRELGIDENGKVTEVIRPAAIDETEFKKLADNYFSKKNKNTEANRFIQKHRIALTAAVVAAGILIYAASGTIKRISNLPTTSGLTSTETLEQFYKAVHNLDVELLQEVGSGNDVKSVLNVVTAMYVTTKTREGYSNELTVSPEKWFVLMADKNYKKAPWMYGLTKVEISIPGKNAIKADFGKTAPVRKEKLAAVSELDGEIPVNGDCKKYTVTYYRIFTHGEESFITIEKNEDYVIETFEKDRWILTSVSTNLISSEELKMQVLREKFAAALDTCSGDVKQAMNLLRNEFDWIPE